MNRKIRLFGGEVEIELYGLDEGFGEVIFSDITEEALRLQKIFNLYDPASELSLLNRKRHLEVSKEMLHVLNLSERFYKMTEGRYDISKGKEFVARKNNKPVSCVSCRFTDILIKGSEVYLENPDILVDLGSIAKGYIVDKLVEYIQEIGIGSAFIDARGDMRIYGDNHETVAIQHPRDSAKTMSPIRLHNQAIATSGDYNQNNGCFRENHIVGSKDLASATIVSNDLADADGLATSLMLLGKSGAIKLLKELKNPALLIGEDMEIMKMNGYEELEYGTQG
ncbi:MAG: FAD:protein FMN transferase [Nanoarchaeota archaeon]|nr:FAD:protein FMN transferase [Nanoarchaeota archaeon]